MDAMKVKASVDFSLSVKFVTANICLGAWSKISLHVFAIFYKTFFLEICGEEILLFD